MKSEILQNSVVRLCLYFTLMLYNKIDQFIPIVRGSETSFHSVLGGTLKKGRGAANYDKLNTW